jgi:hypothetical protein
MRNGSKPAQHAVAHVHTHEGPCDHMTHYPDNAKTDGCFTASTKEVDVLPRRISIQHTNWDTPAPSASLGEVISYIIGTWAAHAEKCSGT